MFVGIQKCSRFDPERIVSEIDFIQIDGLNFVCGKSETEFLAEAVRVHDIAKCAPLRVAEGKSRDLSVLQAHRFRNRQRVAQGLRKIIKWNYLNTLTRTTVDNSSRQGWIELCRLPGSWNANEEVQEGEKAR